MHIFYSSNEFDQVQVNILNHLRDAGHKVHAFCYSLKNKVGPHDLVEGVEYYTCPSHFSGPFFYIKRLRIIAKQCLKQLEGKNIEVLFGNRLFVDGIIFYFINRKRRIPYIVALRNTDLNLGFLWSLPWIRSKGIKAIENAYAIVCLSNSYRRQLIAKLPASLKKSVENKIFVIPNGVKSFWKDNIFHSKRTLNKEIRLITVGRIENNKNQIVVAKAGEILKKENIRIKYLVVGEIKDEIIYNELTKYDFVSYIPYRKKEELIHLYRESDIFVMPSFKESFGLVYAEAMTQGLPVVYTKSQGFDEQFPEGTVGYHVDPNNPNDVAAAIKKIIANYDCMTSNCVEYASKFDWDSVAEEYVSIFEKSLNES